MFRVRLVLNTVGAHFDRASTNLVQAVWLRRWTDDLGVFCDICITGKPSPKTNWKSIGSQYVLLYRPYFVYLGGGLCYIY